MNFLLRDSLIKLVSKYKDDTDLAEKLWKEIEGCYSNFQRHYHNLDHLNELLLQLKEIIQSIKDPDSVLFALYYHDIVYNVSRSDNEEKSAVLAEERMQQLQVPASVIENCKAHIIATKLHEQTLKSDTNYFIDADLSILGSSPDRYEQYCDAVRKEYSIYPDFIYKQGRKTILQRLLKMKSIFNTNYFSQKFEQQARKNLVSELNVL
ncbi:HD domain-containing protein [Niabella ginsengisoli]|uniref:Metal-dependent HD superfamily phosphohydrolase n=1 Tax=Niabella ginsengisoli TaxID=522298 RepID=A0ABS9SN48_9BACT|nr:hypothetical protein [Niabella ginsengisoli]MCH5599784.1 hypothetical protein [Niabella ginsengisoli]